VAAEVLAGVQRLEKGVDLDSVHDFFPLFPAIYALTSTPSSLKRVTRGVLSHFLDPQPAPTPTPARTHTSASQVNGKGRGRDGGGAGAGAGGRGWAAVKYFELRTTPRATPHMSRRVYLETVLDEIEARAPDAAALIVSLDRRMTPEVAREVLELALQLRREGRRVVGLDLCGDPTVRVLAFVSRAICCCQPVACHHRRGFVVVVGGLGKRVPSRLRRDAHRIFAFVFPLAPSGPLCS
jgi:adenosine deaminase